MILKRKLIFLFLILLLFIVACSSPSTANEMNAKVINVVDGDTIDVSFNNKEEKVRLLLVDTPETKHPSKPIQPFGPEASQFAKDTLEGKKVTIELDVSERDKYGRLLAYVWIDGKMFNELLLEKGLARVAYVFPPNTKYVDDFYAIQKKAQQQAVGIWSIENYVQEEGFNEPINDPEGKNTLSPSISNECTIKGNINSKGEKIYHTTESPWYEQTKPEIVFCTEEEAVKAGFRPPKK